MQTITVEKDDLLWKFYKKAYILQERSVEAPKNLCSYVQTAIAGFFFWLNKEVRLLYLWLCFAALVALAFGLGQVYQITKLAFMEYVGVGLIGVMMLSFVFLFVTTTVRFTNWMQEHAPWLSTPLLFVVAGLFVAAMASNWRHTVPALLVAVGIVIAIIAGMVLFVVAMDALTDRFDETELPFLRKSRKVVSTFVAFIQAKKQRICPMVTVADDLLYVTSN